MLSSSLIKLLSLLPAELSHNLALHGLKWTDKLSLLDLLQTAKQTDKKYAYPVELLAMKFPNPIGLAAGLDKNGDYIDSLAKLGFGFMEIGTLTPRPQPGNPQPRLFRLRADQAIINRMGFNNRGIDYAVQQIRKSKFIKQGGILGVNIGKNRDTPVEQAWEDYVYCLNQAYPYASYITVNLSSPNTPGLRDLQFGSILKQLLEKLKERQAYLAQQHGFYRPLCIKLSPDLTNEQLTYISQQLLVYAIDAVIATNTTVQRPCCLDSGADLAKQDGGLSGKPLGILSTNITRQLNHCLDGRIPIIGVGGVMTGEDAVDKIKAGANLVQLYTGLVYYGFQLIEDSVEAVRTYQNL